MVSVEAAIATGSLVAVLALILAAMSAAILQLRCVDAAGEAARLASRGDVDTARRAASGSVPPGGGIAVDTHGETVTVRVEAPPLGSALPGLRVGATATAAREPDLVAPGDPGPDAVADPTTSAAPPSVSSGSPAIGSPSVPAATPAAPPTSEALPTRRPP